MLYLSGGNDALSTLVPYADPAYYARRPEVAVPSGSVLQIGTDAAGSALGLHPNLTGLKSIFDAGRLAIIQRSGSTRYKLSAIDRKWFLGALGMCAMQVSQVCAFLCCLARKTLENC